MTNPVWIIDDDRSIRWVLEKALGRESIPVQSFATADEALGALGSAPSPAVLISDIRMPGTDGLNLLREVKSRYPELPVIIMTAYSDLDSAVAAFQGGAFEYLPKPFDVDQAVALVRRALAESVKQTGTTETVSAAPEMLGQGAAMQEVFRAIGRLSQSLATVLINGESGTGKELVAQALHRHSPRKNAPFIAINTAAIPKDLLESELFGHEKGAFTGATTQRRGRFEQAEGGTLFLDEIGDMPAELQTRLLRVLSDGNFYRVGGHQPVKANVRVIAATHQDLEVRVRDGLFREDLFHRLNVIRLRLPPLRERSDDIPILARHFLQKSAQELGGEPKRLTEAAQKYLQVQPFPGNVRQLENLCHWLTVMAPGQSVDVNDLPAELRDGSREQAHGGDITASINALATSDVTRRPASADWLSVLGQQVDQLLISAPGEVAELLTKQFESVLIRRALSATNGRRIEASQLLGLGRNTITRKIQELGLENSPIESQRDLAQSATTMSAIKSSV